jgi:hypothetical protein
MAEPAARVLRNQADIVRLFLEGERAAYDFLSNHGLLMDDKSYHCDKFFDEETGIGEINVFSLIRRGDKLRFRSSARKEDGRHERSICLHYPL